MQSLVLENKINVKSVHTDAKCQKYVFSDGGYYICVAIDTNVSPEAREAIFAEARLRLQHAKNPKPQNTPY